jgi:hypothetical protein
MRHDADIPRVCELCLSWHFWITATFSPELARLTSAP